MANWGGGGEEREKLHKINEKTDPESYVNYNKSFNFSRLLWVFYIFYIFISLE